MKSKLKLPQKKSLPNIGTIHLLERTLVVMHHLMRLDPTVRSRMGFAARINTTPAAISRWQNGTNYPTVENVIDICKEFSVSPEYLLLGSGDMFGRTDMKKRVEDLENRVKILEDVLKIKT